MSTRRSFSRRSFSRRCVATAIGAAVLVGCGGGSGGSVEAFCDTFRSMTENDPTEGLDFASPEYFDALADSMSELTDAAPSEIQADFEVLRDASRETATVMADFADDPLSEDALAAMESVEEQFPDADAAAERIEDYSIDACPDLEL